VILSHRPVALISGASSGIGKALAREFATHGYDLFLVARNGESLETVAQACRSELGVNADWISLDLSSSEAPAALMLELGKRGVSIDVLVNNAGYGVHGDFMGTELDHEIRLVELQISNLIRLTKLLVPSMIARKRGGILNVASVYSYAPVPHQAVYAACKAFMLSFSEALANEIEPHGVSVTTLCPGVTRTEFRKRAGMRDKSAKSGWSAEEVGHYGYAAFARKQRVAVPGWVNKFFVGTMKVLPMAQVSILMRKINHVRGVSPQN
jgi:short-subunit dehydrogenase